MMLDKKAFSRAGFFALVVPVLMAVSFAAPQAARATSTDFAPDQSGCDSGSASFTWSALGIARPVIASMTVDGETVADPTNPDDGSIGAAICPTVDAARKVGLYVYRRDGIDNHMDLTGAVTPTSHTAITASSHITITLTNMGDLARFYTFSLVHGVVSNWTPAHLGTDAASLTVELSPARTPFGSGPSFAFCTATPPHCSAPQSELDALSASLDMDFDQAGSFSAFSGSYFGLVGAMGGFVEGTRDADGGHSLVATLGAPHKLADGTTLNTGSMQAFLPNSVVETLFGLSAGEVDTSTLAVTRTAGGSTTDASFTVTPVTGGVVVAVPDITFSSPVYTIQKAVIAAVDPGTGTDTTTTSDPALPDTGVAPAGKTLPWNAVGFVGLVTAASSLLVVNRKQRVSSK